MMILARRVDGVCQNVGYRVAGRAWLVTLAVLHRCIKET